MIDPKFTRRGFMAGAAGLAAASAFPGRSQAATNFVVGTFGGTYEKLLREHVIPGFEKANDASVKLELGIGNNFMPKIIASPGRPPYDAIYVNEDEAIFGESAGLWAPMNAEKVPNLANVYDALKPPVLPLYGCMVYEFTCAYNPEKMKKPESWGDLWQSGITVGVPHISATYGVLFLLIAAQLNGGNEDSIVEKGFPKLKQLADMKIYKGVTDGYGKFQRGEIDAALFYRHRAIRLVQDGVKLAYTTPKEGTYGQRTGIQIPKNAPNMDLSLAWANLALSPEYQMAFTPALYSPSNKTVKLEGEMAEQHVYGEKMVNAIRFGDWGKLNPQKPAMLEQWNKEFTG